MAKGPAQLPRDHVQDMLREVAGKVIGIGHLHRHLAELPQGTAIDLGDYLIESSHAFVKSLALQTRIGIVHRLDARCPAKAEQVQPVALIVGEVIMIAVKHAHPTGLPVEISIYCGRNAQGRVVVEIEDDGVGFPENFDPMRDGGTGLRLIRHPRPLARSRARDRVRQFGNTLPAHPPPSPRRRHNRALEARPKHRAGCRNVEGLGRSLGAASGVLGLLAGLVLVVWGELTPHPPHIPGPDKLQHFLAYSGFPGSPRRRAAATWPPSCSASSRSAERWRSPRCSPGRDAEWLDEAANTVGAVLVGSRGSCFLRLLGSRD